MKRSSFFNGNTEYFDWAIFNRYVSHCQKVSDLGVIHDPSTVAIWIMDPKGMVMKMVMKIVIGRGES